MSLLCKLIGHNFAFKRTEDYMKNGEEWQRTFLVQRNYCLRCGTPNPQMFPQYARERNTKGGAE